MTIRDGAIYYTDNTAYSLYRADMNAQNPELVLAKAAFFPYFISDEWLLYQDDADNESLHLCRLIDGFDFKLTDDRCYTPILDGGYLYYTTIPVARGEENDYVAYLCRMTLSTMIEERGENACGNQLAIDETCLYVANGVYVDDKEKWNLLSNDAYVNLLEAVRYVDAQYKISFQYSDGRLQRVLFEDKAMHSVVSF